MMRNERAENGHGCRLSAVGIYQIINDNVDVPCAFSHFCDL